MPAEISNHRDLLQSIKWRLYEVGYTYLKQTFSQWGKVLPWRNNHVLKSGMAGMQYLIHSVSSNQMEVIGRCCTWSVLPQEREPQYILDKDLFGPQSWSKGGSYLWYLFLAFIFSWRFLQRRVVVVVELSFLCVLSGHSSCGVSSRRHNPTWFGSWSIITEWNSWIGPQWKRIHKWL